MTHTNSIVQKIYDEYYRKDKTPRDLVSSHWQFHHGKTKIEKFGNNHLTLLGSGFGDVQNKSVISIFLSWITVCSYLCQLENKRELLKLMKKAIPLARKMGFPFSYDLFRQVCALSLIIRAKKPIDKFQIINIGDGYGFLSSLIKELYPDSFLCLVDLGKTLLFQSYYCGLAHPDYCHVLLTDSSDELEDLNHVDFLYCPAELLDKIEFRSFNIAINIASMQEMNESSIDNYFRFLRDHTSPDNLFYCCNRERKIMPGGEISSFFSYPWHLEDVHLVDDYCPWYKYSFSFRQAKMGPHVFGIRIPFINYFDGPVRHRLTILKAVQQ